MEWCDLPPGCAIRQAADVAIECCAGAWGRDAW